MSNVEAGLRAKVIAFDPDAAFYVVKDAAGKVLGLRAEKLRPMKVLELSEVGDGWTDVPELLFWRCRRAPSGLLHSSAVSIECLT